MTRLFTLIFTCSVMFNSGAQDLTTGLKAHWTFDNTNLDQSGNGRHGTMRNGIQYGTGHLGNSNSALNVVDDNDYFEFPDIVLTDLTVSFWVNMPVLPGEPTTPGNMNVIGWGNGGTSRSRIWFDHNARLRVENDVDGKNHYFPIIFNASQWYHITLSRMGDEMTMYLNGEFIRTHHLENAGTLTLDRIGWVNATNGFKGLVDELHIYDRGLDAADAKSLYNEDSPGLWSANGTSIYYPGKVAIGTDDPGNADFTVKGNIATKEVTVEINPGQGPDFVFEPTYELMTLESLKEFIEKNKHLPEIPPAVKMESEGVELAEMNMKLLQKIEELTLYQIRLLDRLKSTEKRLEDLEKQ